MTGFTDSHRAHRLQQNAARNAARLEDVCWMRDGGESLSGAARRLDLTTEALRQWCRRHAHDVGIALAAREPRDQRGDVRGRAS